MAFGTAVDVVAFAAGDQAPSVLEAEARMASDAPGLPVLETAGLKGSARAVGSQKIALTALDTAVLVFLLAVCHFPPFIAESFQKSEASLTFGAYAAKTVLVASRHLDSAGAV